MYMYVYTDHIDLYIYMYTTKPRVKNYARVRNYASETKPRASETKTCASETKLKRVGN